jgi:ABC-2 type transport system permease protein
MNKLLLKMIMLPTGLWKGMGADIEQLRAILNIKLILDDRKPLNLGNKQPGKKNARFTSALTMLLSFFMGAIYIFPIILTEFTDAVFSLCVFFSLFMFFLTFTLITDFSNALIDARDKHILFSRPVNDRTLFLSKMLHIFIYLFRIILPMSLPGWILLSFMKGWKAAIWFPLPLLLMTFVTLFFVNAIYLLLIKFTKPGRFKEIINYFQIAFSILFFASYYVLPRFVNDDFVQALNIQELGWIRVLPSYWLAATWTWFGSEAALNGTLALSSLAIVFPVLCVWVTIKFLAPNFIRNISDIDGAEHTDAPSVMQHRKDKKNELYKSLANAMNRSDAAKAGFIMTWLQTSRSRSFKMRVFPLFAYVPVYFVYLIATSNQEFNDIWASLPGTQKHLMLLYMTAFVLMQSLNYITMSDQYKAAWVYYSSPVPVPGHVMAGAFKAMWIKYFLPFISVIAVFIISVWGPASILDILLAVSNITLFAICVVRIAYRTFPFSMLEQMNQTGGKAVLRMLFVFFLIASLGFGHYLSTFMWWTKFIFLGLSLTLLWLIWDSYRNTGWADMTGTEAHT